MDRDPGCLPGLFKLLLIDRVAHWAQHRFGRGGCYGCGCGVIIFVLAAMLTCSVLLGTNWFKLF